MNVATVEAAEAKGFGKAGLFSCSWNNLKSCDFAFLDIPKVTADNSLHT
jgi:hypothetical protein